MLMLYRTTTMHMQGRSKRSGYTKETAVLPSTIIRITDGLLAAQQRAKHKALPTSVRVEESPRVTASRLSSTRTSTTRERSVRWRQVTTHVVKRSDRVVGVHIFSELATFTNTLEICISFRQFGHTHTHTQLIQNTRKISSTIKGSKQHYAGIKRTEN